MAGTMQTIHALDHNAAINFDFDDRAHFLQKLDQIDNFRFQGRVLDHCDSFCQGCRNEKILGSHHTGKGKLDRRATQPTRCTQVIASILLYNLCPHQFQAVEVEIDGAYPYTVAAGHRNISLATTMQKRSDRYDCHTIQAAHFGRDDRITHIWSTNGECMINEFDQCTHVTAK